MPGHWSQSSWWPRPDRSSPKSVGQSQCQAALKTSVMAFSPMSSIGIDSVEFSDFCHSPQCDANLLQTCVRLAGAEATCIWGLGIVFPCISEVSSSHQVLQKLQVRVVVSRTWKLATVDYSQSSALCSKLRHRLEHCEMTIVGEFV